MIKHLTPDGWMTKKEIAAHYGLRMNTIHSRCFRKVSPEELVEKPTRGKGKPKQKPPKAWARPTAWGMLTPKQISAITGVSVNTVNIRLRDHGWSRDEAYNTPLYGVKGRHFHMPMDEYVRRREQVEAEWKRSHGPASASNGSSVSMEVTRESEGAACRI